MTREAALKVAKPILFNTEMTQAVQGGGKTATRRIIKPQPANKNDIIYKHPECGKWFISPDNDNEPEIEIKPRYNVGDILYVRETWAITSRKLIEMSPNGMTWSPEGVGQKRYIYKAGFSHRDSPGINCWHPSIHMPKEAARIFLLVTDVRAERLQDMKFKDFLAEGVVIRPEAYNDPDNAYYQAQDQYVHIWNSTIKKSDLAKFGWEANPWVWVYEFELLEVTYED